MRQCIALLNFKPNQEPMKKITSHFLISFTLLLLPTISSAGKLRQVAVLDLPGRPGFESAVFANGRVVITHAGADTVDIFDPVKRRLIAQVNGVASPRGLAVDDAAGMVYIASAGSKSIVVINSNNWRVEGMIGLKFVPENVLVVPGADALLVTSPRDHSVSLVPTGTLGQKFAERATVDVQGIDDLEEGLGTICLRDVGSGQVDRQALRG